MDAIKNNLCATYQLVDSPLPEVQLIHNETALSLSILNSKPSSLGPTFAPEYESHWLLPSV